jgi:hypothetical protein
VYDNPPIEILLRHGEGLLEFCVGEHDSALLVNGVPSAVVWDLPDHPDAHFLLRAYDTREVDRRLRGLEALDVGLSADEPIESQLKPLLRAFTPGRYTVAVIPRLDMGPPGDAHPTARQVDWMGLHEVPSAEAPLVGTLPREALDMAEVDRVAQQIRQGAWPMVVFAGATGGHAAFVVYGQHVLEAYRMLGLQPAALCITAEDPRFLTVQEGCALVRIAFDHCSALGVDHYLRARERQLLPIGV